jgi:hypothetical protein
VLPTLMAFMARDSFSAFAASRSVAKVKDSEFFRAFRHVKLGRRSSLSPQRTQRTQRIGHFIDNYGDFSVSSASSVVKIFY